MGNEVATAEMAKLIDTFGYATVSLGVIFSVFLIFVGYILYQNKQLMKNIMIDNKETFSDLKEAIRELSVRIHANTEISKKAMADVVAEVESLKTKYMEVSAQLFENIYDERVMSDNAFYDSAKILVISSVYKSLLDIINEIDNNGFDQPKRIDLLKESIIRILERRKNELKSNICSLNYNIDKLDYFDKCLEKTFAQTVFEIREGIIDKINKESLSEDKNYLRLKSSIKNKMFEYLDEMVKTAKDTSR